MRAPAVIRWFIDWGTPKAIVRIGGPAKLAEHMRKMGNQSRKLNKHAETSIKWLEKHKKQGSKDPKAFYQTAEQCVNVLTKEVADLVDIARSGDMLLEEVRVGYADKLIELFREDIKEGLYTEEPKETQIIATDLQRVAQDSNEALAALRAGTRRQVKGRKVRRLSWRRILGGLFGSPTARGEKEIAGNAQELEDEFLAMDEMIEELKKQRDYANIKPVIENYKAIIALLHEEIQLIDEIVAQYFLVIERLQQGHVKKLYGLLTSLRGTPYDRQLNQLAKQLETEVLQRLRMAHRTARMEYKRAS